MYDLGDVISISYNYFLYTLEVGTITFYCLYLVKSSCSIYIKRRNYFNNCIHRLYKQKKETKTNPMEQADQFFWFNEEQYYKDGGFYNAEQQYFQGGSTSDYGLGLKISEAVNYSDGGLYNDMHQFQVGSNSKNGLQISQDVNDNDDQQIQLP